MMTSTGCHSSIGDCEFGSLRVPSGSCSRNSRRSAIPMADHGPCIASGRFIRIDTCLRDNIAQTSDSRLLILPDRSGNFWNRMHKKKSIRCDRIMGHSRRVWQFVIPDPGPGIRNSVSELRNSVSRIRVAEFENFASLKIRNPASDTTYHLRNVIAEASIDAYDREQRGMLNFLYIKFERYG